MLVDITKTQHELMHGLVSELNPHIPVGLPDQFIYRNRIAAVIADGETVTYTDQIDVSHTIADSVIVPDWVTVRYNRVPLHTLFSDVVLEEMFHMYELAITIGDDGLATAGVLEVIEAKYGLLTSDKTNSFVAVAEAPWEVTLKATDDNLVYGGEVTFKILQSLERRVDNKLLVGFGELHPNPTIEAVTADDGKIYFTEDGKMVVADYDYRNEL